MTRFARAKGSKASNERVPEEATPWSEMKKQMEERKQQKEDVATRKQIEEIRRENYRKFRREHDAENNSTTEWAAFPGQVSLIPPKTIKKDKPKHGNKQKTNDAKQDDELTATINKPVKISSKSNKNVDKVNDKTGISEAPSTTINNNKSDQGNKRKIEDVKQDDELASTINKPIKISSKPNKNEDKVSDETGISEAPSTTINNNKSDQGNKRKIEDVKQDDELAATTDVPKKKSKTNRAIEKEKKKAEVRLNKQNKKLRRKERLMTLKAENPQGENPQNNEDNNRLNIEKTKPKIAKKQKLNDSGVSLSQENHTTNGYKNMPVGNESTKESKSKNKNIRRKEKRMALRAAQAANPQNNKDNNTDKKETKSKMPKMQKSDDNVKTNESKKQNNNNEKENTKRKTRRKPLPPPQTIMINGLPVEIDYVDNYAVIKEDAERLADLRKQLISRGVPRSEVDHTMKLERRIAEKRLLRMKKKVCLHCRKGGHTLADCPNMPENQESTASGICFKCGSAEHSQAECKVVKTQDFRFATCFICKEQGHISRQCPDNAKGIYPKGGACKVCGDVTHLKKDCPKYIAQQASLSINVGVIGDNIEGLDNVNNGSVAQPQRLNKIIKF